MRSSVKRTVIASLLTVVAIVGLSSGSAAAPDGEEVVNHCTLGEVTSAFEAIVSGGRLWQELGIDEGGLAEGTHLCQYRLFWDQEEVCFCEDDIFLGGVAYFAPTDHPDGLSESEMRNRIAAWESRVFLVSEGGEVDELDVLRTAIKHGLHPTLGNMVYQQHGLILQLPPGDYETIYRFTGPDADEFESTVRLRILPHDTAHLLGPPVDSPFGSVQCPEE